MDAFGTVNMANNLNFPLDGDWRYTTDDHDDYAFPALDDSSWKTMRIPQNWFLGGLDHHGIVWFRHVFEYEPKAEYTRLHFDGVDYSCQIYLNGTFVGQHTGYFEPFCVNVTGILKSGKNTLAVRVDSPFEELGVSGWHIRKKLIKGILNHHDCRPGGGWDPSGQSYNTGGIWNRVYLESHPAITIEGILLEAKMDLQPATLGMNLLITNRSNEKRVTIEVHCIPENFTGEAQTYQTEIDLSPGETSQFVELPVNDIHLWQPWDRGFPSLYEISTIISDGEDTVRNKSLFGFRTIRVDQGYRWFINGQPYFIRGSNYIGSQWLSETIFPEIASAKTHPFGGGAGNDFFSRDVALARQANLNLLRVHAHVLPEEFHTACDRAGILVWQDFPLQWGYSDETGFRIESERQIQAMVKYFFNHPSIVAWCCHNESPWDAPWMAGAAGATYDPNQNRELDLGLQRVVREIDPTRYVHLSSGTGDGHTYPGWYHGHWRDYQDLPGAPFITEYGAQGLPVKESMQRMLPQFKPDAGFAELLRLKNWIDANKRISSSTKLLIKFGFELFKFMEKYPVLKRYKEFFMGWAMKRGQTTERSIYQKLPDVETLPQDLQIARQVWSSWQFHNAQLMETFENGIKTGGSLDEFISDSQNYQAHLIQYGTECYRRHKYSKVTGIIQFDFTDPWPAVTWSVLDYWRKPKAGFGTLKRSMQPVLPSFILPEKVIAGKESLVSFQVINDLLEEFTDAKCTWQLENMEGMIASNTILIDIPADGISEIIRMTLPAMRPGRNLLKVTLCSGDRTLGENSYEIKV
jgi:beta-galactosidase/beta-glucuronidase